MQSSLIDDLATFIHTRMDAAASDKPLYDRNGARLDGQLLQGEINMGTAVLAWLERAVAGSVPTPDEEDEDDEGADP